MSGIDPDELEERAAAKDHRTATGVKARVRNLVSGADFLNHTQTTPSPVWGTDHHHAWTEGQPFMPFGNTGSLKTVGLIVPVMCALAGLGDGEVWGMPVHKRNTSPLYMAWDRQPQIEAVLARYSRAYGENIGSRMAVLFRDTKVRGHIMTKVHGLRDVCEAVGADAVAIDSLKDVVGWEFGVKEAEHLSDAFQECVTNGVEVMVANHNTKAQKDRGTVYSGQSRGPQQLMDSMGSAIELTLDSDKGVQTPRVLTRTEKSSVGFVELAFELTFDDNQPELIIPRVVGNGGGNGGKRAGHGYGTWWTGRRIEVAERLLEVLIGHGGRMSSMNSLIKECEGTATSRIRQEVLDKMLAVSAVTAPEKDGSKRPRPVTIGDLMKVPPDARPGMELD